MRRGVVRQLTRGAAVAIAVTFVASSSRADDCAKPDFVAAFPPDGATDVPTNATLTAHYVSTAQYIDEAVTFSEVLGDGGAPAEPSADGGAGAPDFELTFKAQCYEPGDDAGANVVPELPAGAFCWSG